MATGEPRTVAALVAYDGTEYFGFQVQPGVPTIQGTLEDALSTFTSLQGRIIGAGRTDAGVHARGQVVTAALVWRHDLDSLQRAWNAHLPPSISIRSLRPAPEGFHPRFSARSRTYRYTVVVAEAAGQQPLHAPLVERFALFEPGPLDLAAMNQAAALLVGRQDFVTFGQPPQGDNTVRTVLECGWDRDRRSLPALPGDVDATLVFTIAADAFLKHMVRRLVGSLLQVGRNHWSVAGFADALSACDPARAAPPAPPNGLVLEWVDYDLAGELRFLN